MAANPHGCSLLRWRATLPFALLLAGCATKPVTQEVKIPVYVPCVSAMPVKPTFEVLMLGSGASDGEKVLAIARDTPLHFRYEGMLEAALAGCL
ncbi:hypothetical protein HHL21_12325 [Massilia sp. RP-1-19]|uniref:Uncharacterized protein n=2 Tax=Massilia polaris TaxID=2728846 RepID=A0A848HLC2_9BURK|nr:hypothetical protein [Massilia polaris]